MPSRAKDDEDDGGGGGGGDDDDNDVSGVGWWCEYNKLLFVTE